MADTKVNKGQIQNSLQHWNLYLENKITVLGGVGDEIQDH